MFTHNYNLIPFCKILLSLPLISFNSCDYESKLEDIKLNILETELERTKIEICTTKIQSEITKLTVQIAANERKEANADNKSKEVENSLQNEQQILKENQDSITTYAGPDKCIPALIGVRIRAEKGRCYGVVDIARAIRNIKGITDDQALNLANKIKTAGVSLIMHSIDPTTPKAPLYKGEYVILCNELHIATVDIQDDLYKDKVFKVDATGQPQQTSP